MGTKPTSVEACLLDLNRDWLLPKIDRGLSGSSPLGMLSVADGEKSHVAEHSSAMYVIETFMEAAVQSGIKKTFCLLILP
jgi:hypothetical protein